MACSSVQCVASLRLAVIASEEGAAPNVLSDGFLAFDAGAAATAGPDALRKQRHSRKPLPDLADEGRCERRAHAADIPQAGQIADQQVDDPRFPAVQKSPPLALLRLKAINRWLPPIRKVDCEDNRYRSGKNTAPPQRPIRRPVPGCRTIKSSYCGMQCDGPAGTRAAVGTAVPAGYRAALFIAPARTAYTAIHASFTSGVKPGPIRASTTARLRLRRSARP